MMPFPTSVRRLALLAGILLVAPAAAFAQGTTADSAARAAADSAARAHAADSARIRALADSIVRAQMAADSAARAKATADSAYRVWSAAVDAVRARIAADSVARAQLPPDTLRPAVSFADTSSRFGVDGTRLDPGEWRYAVTVTADTQTRSLGERDVTLSRGLYGPTPAWLLVSSGGRGALDALDSLYVNALTLQALHWGTRLGLAKIGAAFALDTIFGASDSPLGKQNILLPKPGRLIVNGEMLDAVLRLEPLAIGWRDSVMLMLTEPTAAVTTPAQITVTGEEQVTVPAGAFDCWVVDVQAGSGQSRLWVSKTGQVVIRAVQAVPRLGAGTTVQRVLVAGPPATTAGAAPPPTPVPVMPAGTPTLWNPSYPSAAPNPPQASRPPIPPKPPIE